MKSYFNTTNLQGAELWESEYKALKQDEAVLKAIQSSPNLLNTPERVLRHLRILEPLTSFKWHNTPITSIRRSFSNLQSKGLIEKTDDMVKGDYGKRIHTWKLVKNND